MTKSRQREGENERNEQEDEGVVAPGRAEVASRESEGGAGHSTARTDHAGRRAHRTGQEGELTRRKMIWVYSGATNQKCL